jgi:iron(III) transport system substrate-binding protein
MRTHPATTRPIRTLLRSLLTGALALSGLAAVGCERGSDASDGPGGTVVLYSSVDQYVLDPIVAAFEANTGVEVDIVGDTEATKTTGLVNRLLAERANPTADVWWSSEPFGTVRLAEAGVLTPYEPTIATEALGGGGWPEGYADAEHRWHGFAPRLRVIAYHADLLNDDTAPRTLAALTSPEWKDRVGIARPQFGTTRGHMAALVEAWGAEAFEQWLRTMKDNGLRMYDGNATVVAAIGRGEIDVGLTDTDDVILAQNNGARVGMVYEFEDELAVPPSMGPLVIPNTIGLVARPGVATADRQAATGLIEYLLSSAVEQQLAESDSRNFTTFPTGERGTSNPLPAERWEVDPAVVTPRVAEAMAIVDRVFGP